MNANANQHWSQFFNLSHKYVINCLLRLLPKTNVKSHCCQTYYCTPVWKILTWVKQMHHNQALTSTRYPTRPELFFCYLNPTQTIFQNLWVKGIPSWLFPSRPLQTFYNHPQILLFSSRPDTKSSVPKSKCLRYKRWIQGKSGKFDNWFMMHFDLFQSRQSNPRFIHIEAIKSINQDGDKLLSD